MCIELLNILHGLTHCLFFCFYLEFEDLFDDEDIL